MDSKIINDLFSKIKNAIETPRHPLKFGCLASSIQNTPQQRMVVLRAIDKNTIIIYTDPRTAKVEAFSQNPNASLLLYDYEKMEQIILKGTVKIKDEQTDLWKKIPKHAYKDYTSVEVPGSKLNSPNPTYDIEKPNFCILKFKFTEIDYLIINKGQNKRYKINLIYPKWFINLIAP